MYVYTCMVWGGVRESELMCSKIAEMCFCAYCLEQGDVWTQIATLSLYKEAVVLARAAP